MSFQQWLFLMGLACGLPGSAIALILLWTGDVEAKVQWTLTLLIVLPWVGLSLSLRHRVIYSLQTLANLIGALREGDYSLRARGAHRADVLGEVFREVNALADALREGRLEAVEATQLLRKVMEEIDVAIFAFDGHHRLKLVNRTGERLLGRSSQQVLGRTADELGLAECLRGEPIRTFQRAFPGGVGRWEQRRRTFWEQGRPHQLLVLTDLSRTLREEERQAWKRLLRVLGHELNNSLAPIKSMAATLRTLLMRRPSDWEEDAQRGLTVIASRAEALSRFVEAYTRLARLPRPRRQPVDVEALIRRIVALETRLPVAIVRGPQLHIEADRDQLEQLLINLVRNAVDAALETNGGVRIGWRKSGHCLDIWIEDDGPGLASAENLFVPFYTTKPGGTGIGLVLSQQIAEAHGGQLTLQNRTTGCGCVATLRLPLARTDDAVHEPQDRAARAPRRRNR